MPVLGMRDTLDLETDERPMQWRLGILDEYPNAAPLVNVITRTGKNKMVATDPQFHWWERSYQARELTVNVSDVPGAVAVGSADTCGVDSGDSYHCILGTLLKNQRTEEILRVTADPTTATSIAVKRGMGATGTAPAMTAGDILMVMSTAHAEGAPVPTAITYAPTKYTNYCQIMRNSTSNTKTALKTKLRTKDLKLRAKLEALRDHEIDKERAFIHGVPFEDSSGSEPVRGTGGILNYAGIALECSGSLTLAAWRGFVYDVMQDGSDEKLLIAGNLLLETLETMFDANSLHLREVPETDTYGMSMRKWVGAGGTLYITEEKDFSKSSEYGDWGIVIDPDDLTYMYLEGRDTTWLPNRQNPGDDKNIGEWLCEIGLEVQYGATHFGVIQNATAYAGT